jgi:hypothetical protein
LAEVGYSLGVRSNPRVGRTTTLNAPNLRSAGGIWFWADVSDLTFPLLQSLGSDGVIVAYEGSLTAVELSVCEGSARLHMTGALELPSLSSVGGMLDLGSVRTLDAVDLTALASIGEFPAEPPAGLHLAYVEEVSTLVLPSLQAMSGSLHIHSNEADLGLSLPMLQSVGAAVLVGPDSQLGIFRAPELAAVGAQMDISQNPELATLDLPSLASVGGALSIADNPLLPTSQADDLVQQIGLDNIGGDVHIEGNGPG